MECLKTIIVLINYIFKTYIKKEFQLILENFLLYVQISDITSLFKFHSLLYFIHLACKSK